MINAPIMDGKLAARTGVTTGFLTATRHEVYYRNRPGNVASPDGVGFHPENRDRVHFHRPQRIGAQVGYPSTRFMCDFENVTLAAVAGNFESELCNFGADVRRPRS